MGVKNLQAIPSFKVISYSLESGISYEAVQSEMNPGIKAYGTLHSWGMEVRIYNKLKTPLSTNYFLDSWVLMNSSEEVFDVDKGDIRYYPESGSINPGQSATFRLSWPAERLSKRQIAAVAVELSGGDYVFLVPLPAPTE